MWANRIMDYQDKCSTTAQHLNLYHCNAKWSHRERAVRGQKEGYGALCLSLGLINMEARTVVNNLEWKIEGSGILRPLNTEINVPICPGLWRDLIFEYTWYHMYGNASKTLLCALSSRSFCQGVLWPHNLHVVLQMWIRNVLLSLPSLLLEEIQD